MPKPTKGARLGGSSSHQKAILANLATSLFEHGRITTTEAKAKRLRPLAERLVTFAKRGDLHARRKVMTVVKDKGVVHRLFTEIAPDMAEREGGYTRITKIAPRKGDNAPMAVIELVMEPVSGRQAVVAEAERAAASAPAQESAPVQDSTPVETVDPAATEDVTVEESQEAAAEIPAAQPTNEDGSAPEGASIKGNASSKKYHVPGSRWYDQTTAEVWFSTVEEAKAAGFEPAGGEAAQKMAD